MIGALKVPIRSIIVKETYEIPYVFREVKGDVWNLQYPIIRFSEVMTELFCASAIVQQDCLQVLLYRLLGQPKELKIKTTMPMYHSRGNIVFISNVTKGPVNEVVHKGLACSLGHGGIHAHSNSTNSSTESTACFKM